MVFVGEQPGDQEDLSGRPFVGPAGKLLDRALADAGIDRESVYITNAVKHFKWTARGKRRLHQKPDARETAACKPWLQRELAVIRPAVLVCLGATAAQSVLGRGARVLRDRGKVQISAFAQQTVLTVHPSALLRATDDKSRAEGYALFVRDLKVAAKLARKEGEPARTARPEAVRR
jgi:DNA polymerase